MMRTSGLDGRDTISEADIDGFLTNTSWAIRTSYHMILKTTPGAAIFGRDMLYDIPYLADWTEIGNRRQALVGQNWLLDRKSYSLRMISRRQKCQTL